MHLLSARSWCGWRFDQLADAGRRLADLHVNYETVAPYPLDVQVTTVSVEMTKILDALAE